MRMRTAPKKRVKHELITKMARVPWAEREVSCAFCSGGTPRADTKMAAAITETAGPFMPTLLAQL